MHRIVYLKESITTGFIDNLHKSNEIYRPRLLTNDKQKERKVLTSLLKEINTCESFWISVAFLTTSGVASVINALDEFRSAGKVGKILVSDYLGFTQPEALTKILQFHNIDLRMSRDRNFHAKGYLFNHGSIYNLVIGSSNLTGTALSVNTEWNLQVSASATSELIQNVLIEFETEFNGAIKVDAAFVELYRKERQLNFKVVDPFSPASQKVEPIYKPNKMQEEALRNIAALRSDRKNKALLISATGTGKTFLSAFDAKAFKPKRLLFVVHRLNIAEAAKRTFELVFEKTRSMGIYSGAQQDMHSDFLFSTVQTISKDRHYNNFEADHFDYIVVDETHRAAADSYDPILNYFRPKFLLGMTATPERTDGLDVFKLFDYNIAYEIRLQRALEEDMLAPFHYYGVTEVQIEGKTISDESAFNLLVSDARVKHIIDKVRFYGVDHGQTRGLVFCSRNQECEELARKFEDLGYSSIALSGKTPEDERVRAIERLESSDPADTLNYIFTVDIFNEGIDIPSVNQIILLRPTQSAIVFVQQFGRGLRKADHKSYLTVIDFIGNYSNNFLVPIALYGDNSYNRESIRKLVAGGSSTIPGSSTVDFDKIAKERIFDAINKAALQKKRDLIEEYKLLKFKIGRPPLMMDFLVHDSRDPFQYVEHDKIKSYYNFLIEMEPSFPKLSERIKMIFEYYARQVNNGQRIQDSVALLELLRDGRVSVKMIIDKLFDDFQITLELPYIESIQGNLNLQFGTISFEKQLQIIQKVHQIKLVKTNGEFLEVDEDLISIRDNEFARMILEDNTRYSIQKFSKNLASSEFDNGLLIYERYGRNEASRTLNWKKQMVPLNISGYVYNIELKSFVIFVTYHKKSDIASTFKYDDGFENNHEFKWMSKKDRTLESPEIEILKNGVGFKIYLFIKKSDDEESDHYYMGLIKPIKDSFKEGQLIEDDGKVSPVVKVRFVLEKPVKDSVFEYLISTPIQQNPRGLENALSEPSRMIGEVVGIQDVVPYQNCIPYFNVQVAAGNFSLGQLAESDNWIITPPDFNVRPNQFVCRITGESMNEEIQNGSYCVFEKDEGGSRNGKIVLVACQDIQDPDFGAGYTIKFYNSKTDVSGDTWKHNRIVLSPKSTLDEFQDIVVEDGGDRNFRVIGVFKTVLPL